MRSSPILLVVAAVVVGCADAPTAALLQPEAARFELGKAPPPWALIQGELITDDGELSAARFSRTADGVAAFSHAGTGAATYSGWLLVTPGDNAAILRFTNEGSYNVTFSNGAMIMNVNGKVSGKGTMTVDGHTFQLSAVDQFTANGECATTAYDYDGPICASFSDDQGSFSSEASVWTGVLSNDGGKRWDGCTDFDCVCINCEVSTTTGKKGR